MRDLTVTAAGTVVGTLAYMAPVRAKDIAPQALLVYASPMGSQWTAFQARDYQRSIAEGNEALAIDPDYSWTHAYLGMAMAQLGRLDEAVAQVREANRLEDAPMLKALLAHTCPRSHPTARRSCLRERRWTLRPPCWMWQ